jgi:UDP-2,4-diacetamido-2,4,6-trideoxy-beta-L-altropyranose hydrolase
MNMLNKKNIAIRCDSSSSIGTGHLMRTLILADGLKENFNITYFTQNLVDNRDYLIAQNGFSHVVLKDAHVNSFIDEAKKISPALVIIDHYDIDYEDEKVLNSNFNLFVFDDEFKIHHCNFLLNHSIIAKEEDYEKLVNKECKVLCGSSFTLLKDDFFKRKKDHPKKELLITLGGSDPLQLSEKIKKYLDSQKIACTIVTTTANRRATYLKRKYPSTILNCSNMADIMSRYETIITSASTSLLETIALKKSFIAIECASNQRPTVDILSKNKNKNVIKNFNILKLKRALTFLKYEEKKVQQILNRYRFEKNEASKVIINEYI